MIDFTKILKISGFKIVRYEESRDSICFHLRSRNKTTLCPYCHRRVRTIYDHRKERVVKHGMILNRLCLLKIKPRRFYCSSCDKVFSEQYPSLLRKRERFSSNYKREIIFNLSRSSFAANSRNYKVSYHTQRKWLSEVVKDHTLNFKDEINRNRAITLGIDESSFSGTRMVTTIVNTTDRCLKGVLPNKNKEYLKRVLRSLSPKVKLLIKEVVIDMSSLYLNAVRESLPKTKIVVDKFHLIKDANSRIDEMRKIIQEGYKVRIPRRIFLRNREELSREQQLIILSLLKRYPFLKMYYFTKERLRSLYKQRSKEEARRLLTTIIHSLSSTDDAELINWSRTLKRWQEYILNYFDNKSTNAYVEGLHNKMKLIKRVSFGFRNKEVYINKITLSVLVLSVILPHLWT